MTAQVGTISGTWGRSGLPAARPGVSGSYYWWKPPSVFIANLKAAGLEIVSETDYFDWSTALDGVDDANSDWSTAGKALYWWWKANGKKPLSLIAHSHGAQVVAYGLTYGSLDPIPFKLERLVTVGSPVRYEINGMWERIKDMGHIGQWTHIYADEKIVLPDDLGYQELGSSNSSTFPFTRLMPHADLNVEVIPPTTHHGLVWPQLWNEHNFWQYLK